MQVLRCSRLRNLRGWGAGDIFRQVQVLSRVGQEASEGGCRMLKPLTPSSVQADRPLQWESKKTKQLQFSFDMKSKKWRSAHQDPRVLSYWLNKLKCFNSDSRTKYKYILCENIVFLEWQSKWVKNDSFLQYNSMKTQKMSFSFKMKSKMECWNVIANESQPIVLFNGSPRNQIIVIVSPREIKKDILSWDNSFPMNDVYFVQYVFPHNRSSDLS